MTSGKYNGAQWIWLLYEDYSHSLSNFDHQPCVFIIMKYLIAIVLLLSTICTWAQQIGWERFSPPTSSCSVEAPGQMYHNESAYDTHVGKVTHHTYAYQPKADSTDDNMFYALHHIEYPEGSLDTDQEDFLKEFWEVTTLTATENLEGKMVYEDDTRLAGGYPGYIWRIDYNEGKLSIKTKAWLVDDIMYMMQVITPSHGRLNPSIDRFLDSFSLDNADNR